jgi:polysaccharide export outer membrane protein
LGIQIVEMDARVAQRVASAQRIHSLADTLGDSPPGDVIAGRGDVLNISIWEAPPATLFGTSASEGRLTAGPAISHGSNIPEQMVDSDGMIAIPFIGRVMADGRSPSQIAREIVARLSGIAHDPQVIVRISENQTSNVTIVGDVVTSKRMALSAKGERLLDALASAGGVRQPVDKVMIQVTRGSVIASQPLGVVIRDPRQNIRLERDDVVTALFQPYSFQALGAFGTNAEITFEATGLTLAQALGRIGGLQDHRADIKGVFIFRLEDPRALDQASLASQVRTPDGMVPVIYRVDMSDPATFFVAQGFPILNKDVLYVSNAPLADMQKFVNVVSAMVFSIVGIGQAVN